MSSDVEGEEVLLEGVIRDALAECTCYQTYHTMPMPSSYIMYKITHSTLAG